MGKLTLRHSYVLLKEIVREETASGFVDTGAANLKADAQYEVFACALDVDLEVGQTVIVAPGSYDALTYENQKLIVAEDKDVVGIVG